MAGSWIVQAGAAAPAVYAFSDDDLIVTSPEDFEPFPGLEQAFNGVTGTYSEPEDAWQSKEAPKRFSAGYLAEDGRRQVADLAFPAVNHRSQVQRLMASALKDSRRFRRHTVVLPPEARALGPLDVVAWTSLRNGYADKLFAIDLVEDLPSGCVAVSLREIDPGDYDFAADELLPTTTGFLGRPPRLPRPIDFSAEGAEVPDASGAGRRPAIRLGWNPETRAEGVRWQYRLVALADQVPLAGGADYSDDDLVSVDLEVFDGEPLAVFAGEGLSLGFTSDVAAGTTLVVAGILPASEYQVRLRYTGGSWCDWIEVVTPDTRLIADDLDAAPQRPDRSGAGRRQRRRGRQRHRARGGQRCARPGGDAGRRHHRRPRGAARRARRHRRRRHRRHAAPGARRAADRLERRSDLPALEPRGCPRSGAPRTLPHMARSSPASTAAAWPSMSAPARSRSPSAPRRTWPGR